MDDLKVYPDQLEVVDFIQFNYFCTWDPDPEVAEWIDGVDASIWDRLIELENLEGSFEMALGGGEKEYP